MIAPSFFFVITGSIFDAASNLLKAAMSALSTVSTSERSAVHNFSNSANRALAGSVSTGFPSTWPSRKPYCPLMPLA